MQPFSRIFWILPAGADPRAPGGLAIVARPRGGDWLVDEIASLRAAGIALILSLLEPREAGELGLGEEAAACRTSGLGFVNFPIPDMGVPVSEPAFRETVRSATTALAAGTAIGIHCRGSIGRSGMMAASILVDLGLSPDAALEQVAAARGLRVPETLEQEGWVRGGASDRQARA
jgi:protein-tyrosine phosphatase